MNKFEEYNILNDNKWILNDFQKIDGETVWFCERNHVVHSNQIVNGFGTSPEGICIDYYDINDDDPIKIYSINKSYIR